MSLKQEWKVPGRRVITPNGLGTLISWTQEGDSGEVELDEPWAGSRFLKFLESDGIVLESNFSLVRMINLGGLIPRLIVNAQNYSTWEDCQAAIEGPYTENETLIALNFETRRFESNRIIESEELFQILEISLSAYQYMAVKSRFTFEEAKEAWQKDIDILAGTSGNILLCALLDFENKKILARAVFTATKVIAKEVFW